MNRRRAPSACSRVLASAAQDCTMSSACHIAALTSSGLSMVSRLLAMFRDRRAVVSVHESHVWPRHTPPADPCGPILGHAEGDMRRA